MFNTINSLALFLIQPYLNFSTNLDRSTIYFQSFYDFNIINFYLQYYRFLILSRVFQFSAQNIEKIDVDVMRIGK